MNTGRIFHLLETINKMGETPNGIERLAYSDEEKQAKLYIKEQCKQLGMTVREDAAGNIIARRDGIDNSLPAVAIGSHIDTVYNGGRYDGVLGVVCGFEIIRMLEEEGVNTLHPIELLIFTCEESSRFNVSTLGSKAMTGELDIDNLRDRTDCKGKTIVDAFLDQGLDYDKLHEAIRAENELKVFLELHIEQGNKLNNAKKTIGIVTGIAAPMRLSVTIEGKSAHSGTTGMRERQDAFLAASELALKVEAAAYAEMDFQTVATVGVVDIPNAAMNVVPGKVNMKMDIRSIEHNSRDRVLRQIENEMKRLEQSRNVTMSIEWKTEEEPVMMDQYMAKKLGTLCEKLTIPYTYMPSGAGHDSMSMAKKWPTALLFVPSVDGVSHHPDEYTEMNDIVTGIRLLKEAVLTYAIQVERRNMLNESTLGEISIAL